MPASDVPATNCSRVPLQNEQAIDTVIQHGLSDKDPPNSLPVRLSPGRFQGPARSPCTPRSAFDGATGKDDTFLRQTLAKSLAQLGQADVLRTLYTAVADDAFMPRHVGNIGLKALFGKSLEDFEGYHTPREPASMVALSWGLRVDAITLAENKAQRFQAAAAYFKWLKTAHPELYENLTYRRHR